MDRCVIGLSWPIATRKGRFLLNLVRPPGNGNEAAGDRVKGSSAPRVCRAGAGQLGPQGRGWLVSVFLAVGKYGSAFS